MKRVLIILSCICLIVCLAFPALAVDLDWHDYIVSTEQGVDKDINHIMIPASDIPCSWAGNPFGSISGAACNFVLDAATTFQLSFIMFSNKQPLLLDDLIYQDSVELFFEFSDTSNIDGNIDIGGLTWRDSGGYSLGAVSGSVSTLGNLVVVSLDLESMPANAVGLNGRLRWTKGFSAGTHSYEFLGLSFDVLTPGTLTRPTPITIHPQDYIVNESSNGDTSTLYVSVPSSDLSLYWFLLKSVTFDLLKESWSNPFSVTLDSQEYDYWIGCQVFDKLDITDIVNGSTLNVKFDFEVLDLDVTTEQPIPGGVRYQVRYYDSSGAMLDTVKFYAVPDADFFTDTSLDVVIDKPAGAVAMTFICQFMDIPVDHSSMEFTLDLESVNFVCDIPTMVRVQQETGRTNQLLNELVNGDHGFDSSGSNFGSEADQLAGAGNQMNDAMGSGMNSLGSMTNSVAFTGTLTTLAGVMDAVFVGHEITICGVTANPFILLVSILAIAILLPLGLKFVFRKWGSGGGK